MAGSWFDPVPSRPAVLEEPTEKLPVIAPRVGARTVIVYERRSWGLLVLTGLLVALTAGVILGQTVAFQPRAGVAAADVIPPSASASPSMSSPSPSPSPSPSTGSGTARISAPLGRTTALTLEISGAASSVSVVAADLGDRLYDIAGTDDSAVPAITATKSGPVLTFIRTGAPGRSGATVQLSDKVRWTLRFTGSTAEQSVDLRTGKLAALDLAGGTGRAVLRLPAPNGTVPLRITGDTGSLDLLTRDGVPVRLRLGQGAGSAVVDARTRTRLKATTITPPGWTTATNRYDLTATTTIAAVRVTHD
jgi:hypothetical protein